MNPVVVTLDEFYTWPERARQTILALGEAHGADLCHSFAVTDTRVYLFCFDRNEDGRPYLVGDEPARKLVEVLR